jgi:hypothetical protein
MTVRFGLLGMGYRATSRHGARLAEHPDAEVVGVWGRNPERPPEAAASLGTPAYDEVDALISDADAVSVALPPDIQADLAVKAATARRRLLLDKPVALSDGAAAALVASRPSPGLLPLSWPRSGVTPTGPYRASTSAGTSSEFSPGPNRLDANQQRRSNSLDRPPGARSAAA